MRPLGFPPRVPRKAMTTSGQRPTRAFTAAVLVAHVRGWGARGPHGGLDPHTAWTGLGDRQREGRRRRRGHLVRPAPQSRDVSVDPSLRPAGQWDKAASRLKEGEPCTRASGAIGCGNISEGWRLRSRHCEVWKRGSLDWKGSARIRGEAARRSAVGGRGNKPIGVVPKAEVGRLAVSPRCAPRGSEGRLVLAGIPDSDASALSASEAQARPESQVRAPNGPRLIRAPSTS
jgi:hypothetical protein